MVRTVRWGQVSDHSFEPEGWNEFDIEDTAEKPESKDQLLEDGNFTDVPQLKLCPVGMLGVGRMTYRLYLPAISQSRSFNKLQVPLHNYAEAHLHEHESVKPPSLVCGIGLL